ncbi:MAG TPA: hypothetical protein VF712_04675 [Thermoleophilaceae bacterium]
MAVVAYHVLFAVAAGSLLAAALRLASTIAERGAERFLAAAVFAAAAAVAEALVLGLARLGDEPAALTAAAVATWLLAWRLLPAPTVRPASELPEWLAGRSRAEWLAIAGGVGLGAAWLAWWLLRPAVGADSVQYHLPEVLTWIHEGDTGAVHDLHPLYPIGNYPVTNEVLVAWSLGIARSFAPLPFLSIGTMLLLVVGGLSGLRALGVGRLPAALAVAAVAASPLAVAQTIGPNTDLPALAWLVCCASLVASSRANRPLLAPAVVAAGLALGTKTTPALFVLVVLGLGAWAARGDRRLRVPVALATLAAVAVGGTWYLRNLLDHGSPLWPFASGPWGDAAPSFVDETARTGLAERPRATLDGQLGAYEDFLAGALVMVPAALAAALVARVRPVLAAAAATAAGLALWTMAPFTGIPADVPDQWVPALTGLAVNASRYLLPVIAASALTVALASRCGGAALRAALAVLGVALLWDLVRVADASNAAAPPAPALLAGAAAGVLAGAAVAPRLVARAIPGWSGPAALVVLVTVLSVAAPGFMDRHARVDLGFTPGYEGLLTALGDRAGFDDDERPVAFAPIVLGTLSGDRLRHPVELIPADEPCERTRERTRTQWVVVYDGYFFEPYNARGCFAGVAPALSSGALRVYGGG